MQDKEGKVRYLTKIIDTIGIFLNEHVPAKPLKVSVLEWVLPSSAMRMPAFAEEVDGSLTDSRVCVQKAVQLQHSSQLINVVIYAIECYIW